MLSAFYCLFDKGSKKRVNKKCYEKKSSLLILGFYSPQDFIMNIFALFVKIFTLLLLRWKK